MNFPETTNEAPKKKRIRIPISWDDFSYTTRVTLAFGFIAVMTALVAIGVVSFVWEQHFRVYTTENMQTLAQATADDIAASYERSGDLRLASHNPSEAVLNLYPGTGIRVIDNATGETVFDSSNNIAADDSIRKLGANLEPPDPDQLAIATITVDDTAVGSVRMWVYGSDTLLRQTDREFRNNSYQAMFFATVVAIALASCIGFFFAHSLVAPINRVTKTAKAIKEGDLSARTNLYGEDEISRLGMTFDEMAESVEKDRELERRLTTDVAHELRTPLMAIQSTVEAMVDGVFEADAERLETVNSEVQRLSRLVDALLKLSRLENRSTPMKEELVDVGELISGIIATHEAFVADSGLSLSYQAQDKVLVKGDPDMIRQATANLISNAVRYTPEGGKISVRVTKGDLMADIEVKDTGIGLSPEEAKMVFSRFWRADAGRNRASGGLGVGLAVVKEIVDRHGGWVQVQGEKGKGACFTIHIPLYNERKEKEKEKERLAKERKEAAAKKRASKERGEAKRLHQSLKRKEGKSESNHH